MYLPYSLVSLCRKMVFQNLNLFADANIVTFTHGSVKKCGTFERHDCIWTSFDVIWLYTKMVFYKMNKNMVQPFLHRSIRRENIIIVWESNMYWLFSIVIISSPLVRIFINLKTWLVYTYNACWVGQSIGTCLKFTNPPLVLMEMGSCQLSFIFYCYAVTRGCFFWNLFFKIVNSI